MVLILGASAAVRAATVSYSGSYPLSLTNWQGNLNVTRFDPGLGTLTGIKFYLRGNVLGDVKFENLDAAPATVRTFLQAQVTLSRPDFSPLVVTIPVADNNDYVTSFDGVNDFGGTSGRSYLGLTASAADSVLSPPPPSDLALFTGLVPIALPISARGTSIASGAGNLRASFRTMVAADVIVTYFYEPWPPGACCNPDGTCSYVPQSQCGTGDWRIDGVCAPNPCPQPPGACCNELTGDCGITTQDGCQFQWLGANVPCNDVTCRPPVPTERASWGRVKNTYR